jgi:Skp family chaperone for outer membrane proteins
MPTAPADVRARRALILVLVATAAVLSAAVSRARSDAGRPAAAPTRVAIVNFARVQAGLLESKDNEAHVAQKRDEANRKLAEDRQRVESYDRDLKQLEDKKDSPQYQQLQSDRREAYLMGRLHQETFQQQLDEDAGRTVRRMYLKIIAAAEAVGRDGEWDLVLRDDREIVPPERVPDKGGGDRPITGSEVRAIIDPRSILVAAKGLDITDAVIERMNNDFRAAPR